MLIVCVYVYLVNHVNIWFLSIIREFKDQKEILTFKLSFSILLFEVSIKLFINCIMNNYFTLINVNRSLNT